MNLWQKEGIFIMKELLSVQYKSWYRPTLEKKEQTGEAALSKD